MNTKTTPKLITNLVLARRSQKTPNGTAVAVLSKEDKELAKTLVACGFAKYTNRWHNGIRITREGMKAYGNQVK